MRFIKSALENLSLIDLTNKQEVISFKNCLIQQGRFISDYHTTNHNEYCDCREIERTLELFNSMLMYLEILLSNNNF